MQIGHQVGGESALPQNDEPVLQYVVQYVVLQYVVSIWKIEKKVLSTDFKFIRYYNISLNYSRFINRCCGNLPLGTTTWKMDTWKPKSRLEISNLEISTWKCGHLEIGHLEIRHLEIRHLEIRHLEIRHLEIAFNV